MIPDEIRKLIKWDVYPREKSGGQSVGLLFTGVTLTCEEFQFSISCQGARSIMKNRQFCLTVFELYLEEFNICKT